MRRFIRASAAAFALAFVFVGLSAGPAAAVDDTAGEYLLDRDDVEVVGQLAAQFGGGTHQFANYSDSAKLVWYRDGDTGRLRAQLLGKVFVSQGGCGFVRATWTYGNGSTSVSTSGLACNNGERAVDLDSIPTRDALTVRVDLRAGGQFQSQDAMASFGVRDAKVMDGADSDGTCAKVDQDPFVISNGAATLFRGQARFFCAADGSDDIRVRVTGTLIWSDTMAGDRARFAVRFAGLDIATSGEVSQANPTRTVDFTSVAGHDTLTAHSLVSSAPNGSTTFTTQGRVDQQLGKV